MEEELHCDLEEIMADLEEMQVFCIKLCSMLSASISISLMWEKKMDHWNLLLYHCLYFLQLP